DLSIPWGMFETLNQEEQDKAGRFFRQQDRQSFIIRRSVLRILLGHYLSVDPSEIQFEEGSNKKPVIQQQLLHFNVSHSPGIILISISRLETGVDIEKIVADFDYEAIIKQGFSGKETSFINDSEDPRTDFFKLWTRKEAFTKGLSKGLDDDFHVIPSLNGLHNCPLELSSDSKHWHVGSFQTNGYYAAIAREINQEVNFFSLTAD